MYNAESIYKLYEEVYRDNIDGFLNLFEAEGGMELTKPELWCAVQEFYEDPDSYIHRSLGEIRCTADSLLSWKRIYAHEGWNMDFIKTYAKYRKVPILFFPCEKEGINTERYQVFRDRIDHALLDLKNYYSGMETPLMHRAYERPMTKKWLDMLGSFENLVDWMGIKGVLTTENYEIYDLENGNGVVLTDYWPKESYLPEWSEKYYCEIKRVYEELEPQNLAILKSRELARSWCCDGKIVTLRDILRDVVH